MNTKKWLTLACVCGMLAGLLYWAGDHGLAASPAPVAAPEPSLEQVGREQTRKSVRQRRWEAMVRAEAMKNGKTPEQASEAAANVSAATMVAPRVAAVAPQKLPAPKALGAPAPLVAPPLILPSGMNPLVDLNLPHYANSPNMRKFVDALPGLAIAPLAGNPNVNGLGQYIPVGVADTTTYPGSDYYEVALVRYTQKMNSDLPPTDLRGYVQLETPVVVAALVTAGTPSKHVALTYLGSGRPILDLNGQQVYAIDNPQYLGPQILARRGRPVRVKFTNYLDASPPAGSSPTAGGNLPLPVDTTTMGAGVGPGGGTFSQNRAAIHLHGGRSPWISDGTPHQWTCPAVEGTPAQWLNPTGYTTPSAAAPPYLKGQSAENVPDMPDPGAGSLTFYWTNEQSARLLFYHDHAYGITRLNVYAGEAAGYLITDQVEDDLIDGTNVSGVFGPPGTAGTPTLPNLGGLYRYGIPLVVQDKSYVTDASTTALRDPRFNAAGATPCPDTLTVDPLWGTYVGTGGGNLWLPHEYVVNENIYDPSGITMTGRWDYGPWMNPPGLVNNNVLPSPTMTPESFMDTPVVNGTAYPYLTLPPEPVRFRILNACNDRMLNLQLYYAEPLHVSVTKGGSGYSANPTVTINSTNGSGTYTTASAVVVNGIIVQIQVTGATGYTAPPTVAITDATGAGAMAIASANTEVKMVPAAPNLFYPTWPKDGRDGGVPDPTTQGPPWLLLGNEAGFLANLAVVPAQPVDFDYNRKNATFGGVTSKSLLLPPAVRADVVVDLSSVPAGSTLIVYNDAPAPMPLYDVRYDYFTDDPDHSMVVGDNSGGAPKTVAGFGPNTRTVMQIRVAGTAPSGILTGAALQSALTTAIPKAFKAGQDPIIVPESAYNNAYGTTYPDTFANVTTQSLNATGAPQPIAKIMTTLPGVSYTTAPTVSIVGGGAAGGTPGSNAANPGVQATASAGLNPIGGITLLTGGSGYTAPPAVTLGPPVLPLTTLPLAPGGAVQGIQAQAAATISGGQVTAISITEPGAGYTDTVNAPVITIAPPTGAGGVAATAQVMLPTLNTVGSIVLTNAGSGYMSQPQVFLTAPRPALGAAAVAMLNGAMAPTNKSITEGFDPEFGRLFVQLGSTPNPLTPNIGAGPVVGIANYIDPPTEILTAEQPVLWKLTHIGVDSHAWHFHLFDLQVINRVDWANIIKAPYPEEYGWKETIRTNPFEDIIVALKPTAAAMKLPFGIPESSRLLDTTALLGSTANFVPVPPPVGVPAVAQVTNVVTNFGWEYVTHCHLLGHEEHDMMRPMVLQVPTAVPTAPQVSGTVLGGNQVKLTWTDPTPFDYTTGLPTSTLGNPLNEIGFTIQRATGATGGTFTQIGSAPANTTTVTDAAVTSGRTYRYRVVIFNAAGTSTSGTVTITVISPPAAPTNLTAVANSAAQVTLTWTDNATNETGFVVERSNNGGAYAQIAAPGARTGTGNVTYVDNTVVGGVPYSYRVAARNAGGNSAYSNVAPVTTPISMGETAVLTGTDNGNGNLLIVQSAVLSQAGTIQTLSFYVRTVAGNLRLGVYDATGPGGGPGTLQAQTNAFTPTVGWNTANVVTPVSLPAGNYWLAFLPSSNYLRNPINTGTGSWREARFTFGAMPSVFPAVTAQGTAHWSFYGSLSVP